MVSFKRLTAPDTTPPTEGSRALEISARQRPQRATPQQLIRWEAQLTARMSESEALRAIGEMSSMFPHAKPQDLGGYVTAMKDVLLKFPRDVAMRCMSPYGVARRSNPYLPTVPQAIDWCEEQASSMAYAVDWERRARRQEAAAQAETGGETPRGRRKTYEEIQADFAAVGIYIGKDNPHQRHADRPAIPIKQLEQEAILSMDDWMAKRGYSK